MHHAFLTCALTLAVSALSGGVGPSTFHALDSVTTLRLVSIPTQAGQVRLAPTPQTGCFLSLKDSSPLDDEVEEPDEEEDDEPGDLGQAFIPHGRSAPLSADLDAPNPVLLAPVARPHFPEGAFPDREPARFLSLCRILC
jgi:hypothetical protein